MPVLTIRQHTRTDSGFTATLTIAGPDGTSQYDITIEDPFDLKQEQELEFYFEEWIRFPFDQQVIAARAAESVKTYGQTLFNQVFADPDAYSDYKLACRGGLTSLRIEIEGESPDFQAFHWEALKDPRQPRPFAVDGIFTRQRLRGGGMRIALKPSPTINLLVVTARPGEESDVGYRTISRPLIEAIQRAKLRVKVELLRPGTFEALSKHLEGKEGYYHIVHFDAHGGLMTYKQFQRGVAQNRYVYQRMPGQRDIQPYDGQKAFLLFEGDRKGESNPVQAQDLADLLTGKGIPICILNACQSGKQVRAEGNNKTEGDSQNQPTRSASLTSTPSSSQERNGSVQSSETSLGSRLMTAGVQMVVAMGYSVTVSAAALMMETLYGQLFAEKGMLEAIRLGRKTLYDRKNRRGYYDQTVELEDWLLPVVYANAEVDLKLKNLGPREKAEFLMERRQHYKFELPTYGFVGRDLEILKIEKALLRHNILLLRGMGGTGKTTLLNYLREWWQTTHFVEQVFYFGYDETAHTLQQILRVIGKTLYPDTYDFAGFEAMPLAAQMEDVADRLRSEAYGLVLDNLESVTGQALAIQNTLPETEQALIREFLDLLRGGDTKVVLGSRSGEEWLASVFTLEGRANVYRLGGLDPESRSVLAEKILQAQVKDENRIVRLRKNREFQRLMKLLAGYPLAMEVVLANLARQSPKEILQGLQAADVNLHTGGEDKTNNILKCVEYSHSNLSPEAQKLLVCLAPFNSFIDRADLENYGQQLKRLEPFQNYDFSGFEDAIQEAIQWGLLSPINNENPRLLTIQPIFPYFLRTKLNDLDTLTRDAIYDGFKTHYQGLASSYQQLMGSKDPQQRQMGLIFCRLEYENLYSALKICLTKKERIDIFFCLDKYLELINSKAEELNLAQSICSNLENYPLSFLEGQDGHQVMGAFDLLAYAYLETQQYAEARAAYQSELDVLGKLKCLDTSQSKLAEARIYHQLGRVSQELREYEQARSHYQQALDIYIEFNDRYEQAGTYHQLGMVAEELREYEQARSHYQQALELKIEFNDRYAQAMTYHQLGMVSQELREYEQARSHYQQALDIFIEFNARHPQATVYHQLGIVSQELREYEQARSHYQQALELKIEFNDRYAQASTYHQLGMVSQELREYEQAQKHYRQALDIYAEAEDEHNGAIVLKSFVRLYKATQDKGIVMEVAQCLGISEEELRERGWGF